MAKSSAFSNNIVDLIFNATAIANIADNASASPLTSLYVALHTSDPGVGGNQTTNETAYTNYARVAVARNSGGWTVSTNTATNTAAIQFPTCGVTGSTVTHVSIGTATSGAGMILYSGALSSSLAISTAIQPQFNATTLTTTES